MSQGSGWEESNFSLHWQAEFLLLSHQESPQSLPMRLRFPSCCCCRRAERTPFDAFVLLVGSCTQIQQGQGQVEGADVEPCGQAGNFGCCNSSVHSSGTSELLPRKPREIWPRGAAAEATLAAAVRGVEILSSQVSIREQSFSSIKNLVHHLGYRHADVSKSVDSPAFRYMAYVSTP